MDADYLPHESSRRRSGRGDRQLTACFSKEVHLYERRCSVKSQGEIESAVCDGISRFQQEFIGRGPSDIHAHLVGSLLVVRLQGVLTPAERQLVRPRKQWGQPVASNGEATDGEAADGEAVATADGQDQDNGRSLLKQVRSHMIATGRRRLQMIVEEAAGVGLVSVHHDISTVTGEELFAFSLAQPPSCRPKKALAKAGRFPLG